MSRTRRDANEEAIVAVLKRVGATVEFLHPAPRRGRSGLPDLLVGFRGINILLEVKTPTGQVDDDQAAWHLRWRGGPVHVVRTEVEALRAIGALHGR